MNQAPTLPDLLKKFKEYSPKQDTALIEKAYNFAQNAHKDQKRESGEKTVLTADVTGEE